MKYSNLKLAEILSPRSAQVQPKDFGDRAYVGLEHIKGGDITMREVASPRGVKSTKWAFQSGDILYGKLRPYLNKCVVADRDGICSTDILVLRPEDDIDAKYVAYAMSNRTFVGFANSTVSGMNLPRTTWSKMNGYEVAVPVGANGNPDLAEQKRIAGKLEQVFRASNEGGVLTQKDETRAENLAQSITLGAFSGAGLVETKLAVVAEINPRKDFGTSKGSDEVSFVPMEAVDETTGTITGKQTRKMSAVSKGYTFFRDGDVIFAKITPCMENGKCAVARDLKNAMAFGSTEFYVVRANASVLPEYLWHFLRQESVRREAQKHFTGAAGHKRVPKQFLEELNIPIPFKGGEPDLTEQKRIVDELSMVLAASAQLKRLFEKQRNQFVALRSSVLNDSFAMQT